MTAKLLTDSDINAVYKRQYYKLMQNMFSTYGNLWGMIKKTYGKGGDEVFAAIQNTFGGGVGSSADGTLPNANLEAYLEPSFTWNRVYGTVELDGLAIETARKDEHSFVNFANKATVNKMISFNRYVSGNVLFGDGTGALGVFNGNAAGTAAAPVITILNGITDTYQYRKGYWEKGDDVNVGTDSSVFRITAVNHDTKAVTLSRLSGSLDLTANTGDKIVYMQNSKDNDPYGLLGIVNNSTHYSVGEEYRYQPHLIASGGAELEDEMIIELVERYEEETDKYPNVIVFPHHHYRKYLTLQEDKKRIPVTLSRKPGRTNIASEKALAKVSYNGIAVSGGDYDIMCIKSKFLKPGQILALHTDDIEVIGVGQKPGFKSFDGNTFLRTDKDAYKAFLRWYGEIFINPHSVGAITGLPTS